MLSILWRAGEASRVEISVANGLTKPAITQIVAKLEQAGLVKEGSPRRGLRGQPARPLSLVEDAYYSVGVNYSHSYLDVGVIDLKGRILGSRRVGIHDLTVNGLGKTSSALADELLSELSIAPERVLGIGFTAPGDFDAQGRLIAHSYFPGLKGAKLAQELTQIYPLDVFVENDGKACAIGENVIGAGRTARSFMLVHIGHGIGGGIVVDGSLMRGAFGNAGPLGGFYSSDLPRPSGQDLFECLAKSGTLDCDFNALELAQIEAGSVLENWLNRASDQLERIIPLVAAVIDTEVVVLGGRLPPHLLDYMVARIDIYSSASADYPIPRPKIIASTLGSRAGVIGAAFLPIQAHLLPMK